MDSQTLTRMKEEKRVILNFWQYFSHYTLPGIFLIPTIFSFIEVIRLYVGHTYQGEMEIQTLALIGIALLILCVLSFMLQKSRLQLKKIDCKIDSKTFLVSVEETAKQLEWKIESRTNNFVLARSGFSFISWGELITIILENDCVLFNSICDPDNITSIASWGMNKKNRLVLEANIEKNCA